MLFVPIEFPAVQAEPDFAGLGFGIKFTDATPECPGMVLVSEMGNLMGNQIVDYGFGSKGDAPAVVDVVHGRTAAPA